jgi:hypothetical protein
MSFHHLIFGYTRANQFDIPFCIPSMILSMSPVAHHLMKSSNHPSFFLCFLITFWIFAPIASRALLAVSSSHASLRSLIACVLYSSTSFLKSSNHPKAIIVFVFQKSLGFWFFSMYCSFA